MDSQPQGPEGKVVSVERDIWPGMERAVKTVFECVLHRITRPRPQSNKCFELYGMPLILTYERVKLSGIQIDK